MAHRGVISRALLAGASWSVMGCQSATTVPVGVPRAALLALAMFDSFPPPPTTVFVKDNRLNTDTIVDSDAGRTVFAVFTFTQQSIVQANGLLVCDTCTVAVQVTPTPGAFGFTLGPSGLVFNVGNTPTVTVSFARYADYSVADSSPKYPTAASFAQALELWFEQGPDQWALSRNSAHVAAAAIQGGLDAPGAYLIAAPK